jgi:PAS domain S-box-containing protein
MRMSAIQTESDEGQALAKATKRERVRRLLPFAGAAAAFGSAMFSRQRELASERRFRALANAGSALIRQEDADGNAIYFNEPWLAFTRRLHADLLGRGWLNDVHPDDRPTIVKANEKATRLRAQYTVEYRLRRSDGDYRWMIEHSSPYRLENGEIHGSLSSLIDISDRKRAEAGLELLASTGVVITSSLDLDEMLHRFARHVTRSFADWCSIHLMRDGELELSTVATADARHYQPLLASMRNRQTLFNNANVVARLQDEREPVLVDIDRDTDFSTHIRELGLHFEGLNERIESIVLTPMTARGRFIGTLLLASLAPARCFDVEDLGLISSLAHRLTVVVENGRLFAEAQAAEERYRRFFSGSADAIVVADQSFTVREANPAFEALYGARQSRMVGRSIGDLLALPDDAIDEMKSTASSSDWRGNLVLTQAQGDTVNVEVWLGRLVVPEGPIIVAAIRDISERTRFEASRRRLLASVSHDLKNPLNSIKANAQLAMRQIDRGSIGLDQAAEVFRRIDGLTNRMVSQIADLMDVSLLETGSQLELELSEVDLIALTGLVVDQYQATTSNHRILIRTELDSMTGVWDAHRIERVLTNLLTNAIKYSPAGGEIVFAINPIRQDDGIDWVEIALADQGIGIEPEDLSTLFTRIGRGRNVTERFAGTGIGLVGVGQIVQQHGGTIGVESKVGEGSTFRILLPIRPPETTKTSG